MTGEALPCRGVNDDLRCLRTAKVVHTRAGQRTLRRLPEHVPPVVIEYRRRVPGRLWAAREHVYCRLCRDDDSAPTVDRAPFRQVWPATGHPGQSCDLYPWVARLPAGDGCLDLFALSHDTSCDHLRVCAVARDHPGYRTCAEGGGPHGLSVYRVGDRADVGPDVRRGARSPFWLARELHRFPCLWHGSACLVLVRSWRDQQKSVRDVYEAVQIISQSVSISAFLGLLAVHGLLHGCPLCLSRCRASCCNGGVADVASDTRNLYGKHRRGLHSWQLRLGAFCCALSTHNDDRRRQGCCLCRIDRGPGFATRRNRARVFLVRLVRVSRRRQRDIDAEQQCRCDVSPTRVGWERCRAFRCTHRRRRGPDVRNYEHRSERGERGIRLARNDACFVDNGVAGSTVRALPRPTQDQGEPSLVGGELPLRPPDGSYRQNRTFVGGPCSVSVLWRSGSQCAIEARDHRVRSTPHSRRPSGGRYRSRWATNGSEDLLDHLAAVSSSDYGK